MPTASDASDLTALVWQRLFNFIVATVPQRDRLLRTLGLTPAESRALHALGAESGRTMRSLAAEWECDPSNATWLIDRLAKKDLVRRRSVPTDRRKREVVLTPKGSRLKARLIKGVGAAPPELVTLDRASLQRLYDAVQALPQPPENQAWIAQRGPRHPRSPTSAR